MVEYALLCSCSGRLMTITPTSLLKRSRMKSGLSAQRSANWAGESCWSWARKMDSSWVGVDEVPVVFRASAVGWGFRITCLVMLKSNPC